MPRFNRHKSYHNYRCNPSGQQIAIARAKARNTSMVCYAARLQPLACQHYCSDYKSVVDNKPTTKGAYKDPWVWVSINQSMASHSLGVPVCNKNQLYVSGSTGSASKLDCCFDDDTCVLSYCQRGASTHASAGLPCLHLDSQLGALPKACALVAALLQSSIRRRHFCWRCAVMSNECTCLAFLGSGLPHVLLLLYVPASAGKRSSSTCRCPGWHAAAASPVTPAADASDMCKLTGVALGSWDCTKLASCQPTAGGGGGGRLCCW
jgi:hypothetical protein